MRNQEVAHIFYDIARMLDIKGANPFRIRAYERAAQNIEGLPHDLDAFVGEDALTSIPGIGKDLAQKIKELLTTGKLAYYEQLKKEIPAGILEMMNIPGVGPKTIKNIYEKLKIRSMEQLEKAAKEGKLKVLEGIKAKTEENIVRGIALIKKGRERTPLYLALGVASDFLTELRAMKEVKKIEVAGSLRRRKETIRDIDILVVSKGPSVVMERFTQLSLVREVLAKGGTKSSIIAQEPRIQVDVRVVEEKAFGSALMYFTGSKEFNIKMRQLAIKRGYKINEYGVFLSKGTSKKVNGEWVAGRGEEDIFKVMKMAYIPPELREDQGEIEAALANKLPPLVTKADIKGDFHVHSRYSDGNASLEEIAKGAYEQGYQYVGVCDHSQGLKVARGLSQRDVFKKREEIKKINKKSKAILLAGAEVDILSDGSLDYPPRVLKEFDLVIAAIHSGFKQSKEQLTKRIIAACKNKYVHIIAHPTGRLWGTREGYEINLDEIFKVCRDYKVALEINCYPQRCDLNASNVLRAKKAGVMLALGTDAHTLRQLEVMTFGVSIARRGWLQRKDVLNCMDKKTLYEWLKK